ncbi:MAG: hypothetical protein KDC05_05325, partial [Bacteroidales bacterium]|nr:hypothetical protein [Bacteroidales bacterium]
MDEQIFILNENQTLIELNESGFVTEVQFQELLEKYPNLISGSQINPGEPRKWILISREIGIPGEENGGNKWSLDHLLIDQDGIPTLVEVKRSSDTRIRREVVGQMLDYAANAITYWPIAEIRLKFENYCNQKEINPDEKILEDFEEYEDVEQFWEKVDTNLKAGKIRMLFVADRIPRELQRIIEFLNEQMNPAEVLGVEIKQFGNETIKTLVPRIVGQTSSAQIKKGSREYNQWTEESIIEELERRKGNEAVMVVRKLLNYFKDNFTRIWYGKGKRNGSFVPVLEINGDPFFPMAIWTTGHIEIYFQYIKNKPPFDDLKLR